MLMFIAFDYLFIWLFGLQVPVWRTQNYHNVHLLFYLHQLGDTFTLRHFTSSDSPFLRRKIDGVSKINAKEVIVISSGWTFYPEN